MGKGWYYWFAFDSLLSLQGMGHLTKLVFIPAPFLLEMLILYLSEPPLALTVESLLIPME